MVTFRTYNFYWRTGHGCKVVRHMMERQFPVVSCVTDDSHWADRELQQRCRLWVCMYMYSTGIHLTAARSDVNMCIYVLYFVNTHLSNAVYVLLV